jgi:hypothetical protein
VDDRHQPAGQRHCASTGTALGVGLEGGVRADLDHGADYPQLRAVQIECIETQARDFAPGRPAPAAVAMIAWYRSGAAGSSLLRNSPRLMTWSVVSCRRRRGGRMPSQGLNAISRFRTKNWSTAEVRRWASATVAGARRVPSSVIHFCTDR